MGKHMVNGFGPPPKRDTPHNWSRSALARIQKILSGDRLNKNAPALTAGDLARRERQLRK